MNVPNLLSLLRIAAIPVVVGFLFFPGPGASPWAAIFFAAISLTDLLDGYIARQQKSESAMGKLLDPMADKLLINAAMIMLIPLGRIPAWMVVFIVSREVAVTGLRGIASVDGHVIGASRWGKAKTVLQSVAVGMLILHYEYLGIDFHLFGMGLMWIALGITLWSGIDYFVKFYREYQGPKPGGEDAAGKGPS
ncbi:MAG: CDP-diacylglycerol--glycerol-3-phosphate 3-phosphatidyltransferase [Deltaproteobacteria bacterium]|nr:CDP-diacylglycerol--glycerol-3-phosphate 3-phosphatidyltransferase [Deltaproteobacteria bacterium]